MSDAPASASSSRIWWLAGCLAFASTLLLLSWFWQGGLPYDSSSGVWATLAHDISQGELYRPVEGPAGYGGTRYMPLFFSIHGALIHAGWPVAGAGMALTLASLGGLLGAAYVFMRRVGATAGFAVPATLVITASISVQLLGISIKGDLLAAALNLVGLVLAVRGMAEREEGMLRAAGVVLSLAILTKFTEVFGLLTLVVWLGGRKEWRLLAAVLIPAVLVTVTGLSLANWLSGGRMAEAFAVCATGGLNLGYAYRFPLWFARVAGEDPFFVAIALAGLALAVRRSHRVGGDLLGWYFAVTAVFTVLMFASPGTDSNHLIDLLVAALAVIAAEFSSGAVGRRTIRAGSWVLVLAIVATWVPGIPSVFHFLQARGRPTQAAVDEIVRRLPRGSEKTWLSENPIVPLAVGERPAVLDSFSLRLLASRSSRVRQEFLGGLTRQRYSAVILVDWSGVPQQERWSEIARHTSLGVTQFYGEVHFPAGFLETLESGYRLSFVTGPFVVFEPRGRSGSAP